MCFYSNRFFFIFNRIFVDITINKIGDLFIDAKYSDESGGNVFVYLFDFEFTRSVKQLDEQAALNCSVLEADDSGADSVIPVGHGHT